jgi:phospholipid transport system substrate-binding protein
MVRRSRIVAALTPIAAALLAWTPASAGPPTERLRGFFSSVNAVLADPTTEQQPLERVARIRRIVAEITDIPSAAAAALGPEWAARSPAEREEFAELFAELLERAYVGRLAGAVRVTGSVTLKYVDEVVDGDTATVTTAVLGTDGHVQYRMTLRGGRWQVRDIVLDGVSVVDNYRAQFKRLLQQDRYPAVVSAMRAKLAAESLLFAGLPRRTTTIVTTPPRPEGEAVVASTSPAEAPLPPPPPPRVEPPTRSKARPANVVAPPPRRPTTALVAAASPAVVVPPPPRAVPAPTPEAAKTSAPASSEPHKASAPAPRVEPAKARALTPEPAETSAGMGVVLAVLLLILGLGGLAYRRLRATTPPDSPSEREGAPSSR